MKPLNPPTIAPPFARYVHGVELPPDLRLVHTSGQLALTRAGTVPEGAEAQAHLCLANIAAILEQAGMTAADIFHLTAYVTSRADMQGYMAARDAFLAQVPETALPTSTLLIVSGFTRAEFLVEIEAWAAAP